MESGSGLSAETRASLTMERVLKGPPICSSGSISQGSSIVVSPGGRSGSEQGKPSSQGSVQVRTPSASARNGSSKVTPVAVQALGLVMVKR